MLVRQYKFFIDYLELCVKDIYKNKNGFIKTPDIVRLVKLNILIYS